jgi:hypothetical protein
MPGCEVVDEVPGDALDSPAVRGFSEDNSDVRTCRGYDMGSCIDAETAGRRADAVASAMPATIHGSVVVPPVQ